MHVLNILYCFDAFAYLSGFFSGVSFFSLYLDSRHSRRKYRIMSIEVRASFLFGRPGKFIKRVHNKNRLHPFGKHIFNEISEWFQWKTWILNDSEGTSATERLRWGEPRHQVDSSSRVCFCLRCDHTQMRSKYSRFAMDSRGRICLPLTIWLVWMYISTDWLLCGESHRLFILTISAR